MANKLNGNLLTVLWENGLTDTQIIEQTGYAKSQVRQYRQRHGMTSNERMAEYMQVREYEDKEQAIREVR